MPPKSCSIFIEKALDSNQTIFFLWPLSRSSGQGFGVGGGGMGTGDGGGKGGIGAALLKKLGYKEGGGLGKDGQGITRAIQSRAIGGGKGVINGPPPGARG